MSPATTLAWMSAALITAASAIVHPDIPWPAALWAAALTFGVGCVHASLVAIVNALALRRWPNVAHELAWWSFAGPCALALTASDIAYFSHRNASTVDPIITMGAALIVALAIQALARWGVRLGRPAAKIIVLGACALAIGGHPWVFAADYEGLRAVTVLAGIAGFDAWIAHAAGRSTSTLRLGVVWAIGIGLAISLPHPTAWIRANASPIPTLLARAAASRVTTDHPLRASPEFADSAWYRSRRDHPPVPASALSPLPKSGVVILVVVDSLRADVIHSREYDTRLPTFARLRDQGVEFRNARSAGTQTVYAVSALFAGTHFSQQWWTRREKKPHTPWQDPTPRFPAALVAAGIDSVNLRAIPWVDATNGVAPGFSREPVIESPGHRYARADDVISAMLPELAQPGPRFIYAHLADPHAPYARGEGTEFERYLREVEQVDRALDRLWAALGHEKLRSRSCLIVTSDHGEAFGEHRSSRHGSSLYDEQLRIPMIVNCPRLDARRVSVPVSLIDLGPTILDLFGLPTPGHHMGQSLVPSLRGDSGDLERPIVAETRLRRSMLFDDGRKLIVDLRSGRSELYDLPRDPLELRDLAGDADVLRRPRAQLQAFFRAHRIDKPGYRLPYRR